MNLTDYKNEVASLGCLIKGCNQPANLHHPRFCCGIGQRASDWLVVPLCAYHHQNGGYGMALHAGQATWEKNFMTEQELVAETIKRMMNR
ncbi:MAG: DUF968 domain-containing protein [Gammaproteobacteria bacterium]|nr:DUF968 domain-containing protein [Gammaproteobacteria bacterium]